MGDSGGMGSSGGSSIWDLISDANGELRRFFLIYSCNSTIHLSSVHLPHPIYGCLVVFDKPGLSLKDHHADFM